MVFIRKTLNSGNHGDHLGECIGPFIFLREDAAQYRGILIHEQRHALQFWVMMAATYLILKAVEYLLSDGFNEFYLILIALMTSLSIGGIDAVKRMKEIDAFKTELKYFCYDGEIAIIQAYHLSRGYFPEYPLEYFYAKLATGTPLESQIDTICRARLDRHGADSRENDHRDPLDLSASACQKF